MDPNIKTNYVEVSKGDWGSEFNINPEGYDKMMLPGTVMRRLKSRFLDSARNETICAGYIPTTFKLKPEYKAKADAGKKLEAAFTVWRFHLLPPSIARRCSQLEKNSIGKELGLKSAGVPGPAFLVALPVASADASESDDPDDSDGPRWVTRTPAPAASRHASGGLDRMLTSRHSWPPG